MAFNPLISVIVPVYNGADYVCEAIESILSQTYKNFEIVVVNDGSSDNGATHKALEPYFDRVKYILQENGGVAAALNTGIKNMSGDYFAWLSHDDLFLPGKLASQVAILSDLQDPKVVIYSDYSIIDFEKKHLYDVVLDAYMLNNSSNHMPVLRGCLNGCTMLVHKDIFVDCGVFDQKLKHTQDYEMWERICWKYPLIHQADITVQQRVHEAQDSKRWDAVPECDSLWINIIQNRDTDTRVEISGSSLEFLEGMQKFLSQTPYTGAQEYVQNEILKEKDLLQNKVTVSDNNLPANTMPIPNRPEPPSTNLSTVTTEENFSNLTIIVHLANTHKDISNIINAFYSYNHDKFEVIIVAVDNKQNSHLLNEANKTTGFFRLINISHDLSQSRIEAIKSAKFDYVMMLSSEDIILRKNLSQMFSRMKEKEFGVTYSPYLSVCEELSSDGLIVPSHWIGECTTDDIVSRCAINLSSMIFKKQVFFPELTPPDDSLLSELVFMLNLRHENVFHPFDLVTVVSQTRQDAAPINLTHCLDTSSSLLSVIESHNKWEVSQPAIESLREINAELYTQRASNEQASLDLDVNCNVKKAYEQGLPSYDMLGRFGVLNYNRWASN